MTVPDVGQVLAGKYRVERVLGQGGMGVVVQAMHLQLEERVAVKFLLPDYAQQPEAAARFLREARAAVKIKSEHVARVIDVGTLETGAPYMVMEFLSGRDLSDILEARKQLPVEEAVEYVLQATEALAEAHAAGIVHRDLKPANLFLTQRADGSAIVKVLDFGISKVLVPTDSSPGADHSLTKTSAMMGSPLYMSPEQMRSARTVDARADIWSLGAILYELISGRPPFDAESLPELCAMILTDDLKPLQRLRPDVPEPLAAAVARCLEKDPSRRFPSVAELAVALSPFVSRRARVSVERISKVMSAAGMSNSVLGLDARTEPPPPDPRARTAANFGSTASGASDRTRAVTIGATVLGLAFLAAIVGAFVLRARGEEATASVGSSPVAAAPVAAAAAAASIAPPAAAPPATTPTTPPADPAPAPAPSASAAAPPAPAIAAPAPRAIVRKTATTKTATTATAKAAPAPAPAPKTTSRAAAFGDRN